MKPSAAAGSVSVVIPVYNGAATLDALVAQVTDVLPAVAASHEIVLVNDGSRDESWAVILRLAQRFPSVHGLNLMRNYGQHNALLAGIRAAREAIIVTMDDDLQHLPAAIPQLLAALTDRIDVVYGVPRILPHSLWRNVASAVTKLVLQSTMGAATARQVTAFRAFRRELREAFASYQSPYLSIDVLLTWATSRFTTVTVEHQPRRQGASNYTWRSLARHALNMMTGFSTWPLRLASLVGFGATVFGLLVLTYVIGRYFLQGGAPPGFPFLVSIIAIFSGAQLFALGIMGEYLARMHVRMMERPPYVVRERTV